MKPDVLLNSGLYSRWHVKCGKSALPFNRTSDFIILGLGRGVHGHFHHFRDVSIFTNGVIGVNILPNFSLCIDYLKMFNNIHNNLVAFYLQTTCILLSLLFNS